MSNSSRRMITPFSLKCTQHTTTIEKHCHLHISIFTLQNPLFYIVILYLPAYRELPHTHNGSILSDTFLLNAIITQFQHRRATLTLMLAVIFKHILTTYVCVNIKVITLNDVFFPGFVGILL